MPASHGERLAVVVEDDDSVREMLCELFQSIGFRVTGCSNGRDGLQAVKELHPSVLTLDLHMPGMDGVEVLDHLTDDVSTAALPVVVVSAYAPDRRVRFCDQVKAIVSKPFDVDDLCAKVCLAAGI